MPKRLLLVYPLAACILTGVPTHAFPQQSPPVTPAPAEEEADRKALRQLKTTYEQAIRDNQIELLAPHLHRDFHGVMTGNLSYSGLSPMLGDRGQTQHGT